MPSSTDKPFKLNKNLTRGVIHLIQLLLITLTVVATILCLVGSAGVGLLLSLYTFPVSAIIFGLEVATLFPMMNPTNSASPAVPQAIVSVNKYARFITTFAGRALTWLCVGMFIIFAAGILQGRWARGVTIASFVIGWVIWGFGLGHILLVIMSHTFGFHSWIWEEEGTVTPSRWDDEDTTSGANRPLLRAGYQSISSGNQTSGGELPV